MGFFWDTIQHMDIEKQKERATSLEDRVSELEVELRKTQELLVGMVTRLEARFGEDFDGDGEAG